MQRRRFIGGATVSGVALLVFVTIKQEVPLAQAAAHRTLDAEGSRKSCLHPARFRGSGLPPPEGGHRCAVVANESEPL
jgi:hypothetical protein